jgi:hypothetical protein
MITLHMTGMWLPIVSQHYAALTNSNINLVNPQSKYSDGSTHNASEWHDLLLLMLNYDALHHRSLKPDF